MCSAGCRVAGARWRALPLLCARRRAARRGGAARTRLALLTPPHSAVAPAPHRLATRRAPAVAAVLGLESAAARRVQLGGGRTAPEPRAQQPHPRRQQRHRGRARHDDGASPDMGARARRRGAGRHAHVRRVARALGQGPACAPEPEVPVSRRRGQAGKGTGRVGPLGRSGRPASRRLGRREWRPRAGCAPRRQEVWPSCAATGPRQTSKHPHR